MPGKKPKVRNVRTISQESLRQRINLVSNERDKAFICFLYLSGARVSEVCKKVVYDQIQPDKHDKGYIEFKELEVLKLRGEKKGLRRTVAINKVRDKAFLNPLMKYVHEMKVLGVGQDEVVWDFGRKRGWQIVKKYFPEYFCHYFRSLRARFLVTDCGFSAYQLQKYFGWGAIKSTAEYVVLTTKDIKY